MTAPAPFSGGRGLVSKPPKRSGVDIQLLLPHHIFRNFGKTISSSSTRLWEGRRLKQQKQRRPTKTPLQSAPPPPPHSVNQSVGGWDWRLEGQRKKIWELTFRTITKSDARLLNELGGLGISRPVNGSDLDLDLTRIRSVFSNMEPIANSFARIRSRFVLFINKNRSDMNLYAVTRFESGSN